MLDLPNYDAVQVGDSLLVFTTEPVSRLTLALYCGASGDHNPIHVDSDFAQAAGLGDVIAHGMLGMAYLARALTAWVPQTALCQFSIRFSAVTRVGERIVCHGRIADKLPNRCARVDLTACNEAGETKLVGDAVVALR